MLLPYLIQKQYNSLFQMSSAYPKWVRRYGRLERRDTHDCARLEFGRRVSVCSKTAEKVCYTSLSPEVSMPIADYIGREGVICGMQATRFRMAVRFEDMTSRWFEYDDLECLHR